VQALETAAEPEMHFSFVLFIPLLVAHLSQ
jgi:hypothetical protein